MNEAALMLEPDAPDLADELHHIGRGGRTSSSSSNTSLALNETPLPARLEMLKNVALNLLKEVQVLNTLETADITRGINFYDEVERFERELIGRALELTSGHQVRAARLLGLKATTLNSKVKRYRIPLPHDAPPAVATTTAIFPQAVD